MRVTAGPVVPRETTVTPVRPSDLPTFRPSDLPRGEPEALTHVYVSRLVAERRSDPQIASIHSRKSSHTDVERSFDCDWAAGEADMDKVSCPSSANSFPAAALSGGLAMTD